MNNCSAALLLRNSSSWRRSIHIYPPLQLFLSEIKIPCSWPTWFKGSNILLVKHRLLFLHFQVRHNIIMHWRQFCGLERNSWQIHTSQSRRGTFQYWQRHFRYCVILWSQYFSSCGIWSSAIQYILSPLSSYPTCNEYSPYWCLGRVFIVSSWWFICGKWTEIKVLVWTVFTLLGGIWIRRYLWNLYRRQNVWCVGTARSDWCIFSEKYFEFLFTE